MLQRRSKVISFAVYASEFLCCFCQGIDGNLHFYCQAQTEIVETSHHIPPVPIKVPSETWCRPCSGEGEPGYQWYLPSLTGPQADSWLLQREGYDTDRIWRIYTSLSETEHRQQSIRHAGGEALLPSAGNKGRSCILQTRNTGDRILDGKTDALALEGGNEEISTIHSAVLSHRQVKREAKTWAAEWWLLLTLCFVALCDPLLWGLPPTDGRFLNGNYFLVIGQVVCISILSVKISPLPSLFFDSPRRVSPEAF